ncbi:MAG: chloride channel protein [Gemmatimonadales bacterium]
MDPARKSSGPAGAHATSAEAQERQRGDFTTDSRVLVLAGMAAVIGAFSAFVALALVKLIDLFTNLFYYHRALAVPASPAGNALGLWAILVPVLGGLVIGLMARYGSEKIRGHGIPEAMEAILIGQSRMDLKTAILKPLSSALSIGAGGPFGAEGPIIMTGGAFGSLFAQAFHLSSAERKTLLVAGAAGGMTGIFATPLAATLLAVELLLFEWKPRSFIPVAVAACVAAVVRVPLLGAGPIFQIPPHAALDWRGMAGALALGLLTGLGSSVLTLLVYAFEDLFGRLPVHWMWWPLIGGLAIGVGGLIEPRALGVGYGAIADLLAGQLVLGALISLLVVKALIWSIALGSGTSGGVLAPLLMMGGALGALSAGWLPGHDAGQWALIGMGAMMGGTMRSPFTAIAFAVELTRDVAMIPPLLVACVAADAVTVLLMKRSILTEKVARRGHHVMREYGVNPLHLLRVEDAMDLDAEAVGAGAASVTYADELLEEAARRMLAADVPQLPVVSRDDPTRAVGYLRRSGMMAAWLDLTQEEHAREPGWLTSRGRLLRGRLRRVLGGVGQAP